MTARRRTAILDAMPQDPAGTAPQASAAHASPEGAARPATVTGRSLLIGAAGAAILGLGCPYATHVLEGSFMDIDFSTAGAVFLLFVLVAGPNLLLRALRPAWALNRAELISAYIMMVVASAVTTMGLSSQLPPLITAPYYYATPENKWAGLLLPHLKDWLSPAGSAIDAPVIVSFYEGAPPGTPVPWRAWAPALVVWLAFLLCLHFVMICMMVLMRRQWVEREKLAYPLTQLPLEMSAPGRLGPPLLRSWWLWAGFGLPMVTSSFVGLHNYFPAVPAPRLYWGIPVFRRLSTWHFRISAPMIGFFYLVGLETVFSLWFFNLLMFASRGVMNIFGVGLRENLGVYGARSPTFAHLGMGAMAAMVLANAWIGREHLAQLVGWGKRHQPGPAGEEIMPPRMALWGAILGLTFMGVWLGQSGMPGLVVPLFLALAMLLFVGLTRIVAESGMAEAVASTIAPGATVSALGSRAIGASGVVAMGVAYVWCSDIRTYVMASAANSLKMAEVVRENRPRLLAAMGVALAVAISTSLWLTIRQAYLDGGMNMESWYLRMGPIACYRWVVDKVANPTGPNLWGWVITLAGAALYLALTALRFRFVRWPFHPLGITIGGVWIMDQIWFTCFLAWLAKWTILRYGGLKAFRQMRPFFLGLILGQFTCNGLWLIVDAITGHTGNAIFWI
ncbi:MAG: DUF6785 family protein [Armatimonadota bacterium]